MDEGVVRQASMMFGLVAEMNAIIAEMEGMKAENQLRALNSESPAFGEINFVEIRNRLNGIAHVLQAAI